MNSNPASMERQDRATSKGSMLICDYMQQIEHTDRLPKDNLQPVLMGLFGEVGSIMTTVKKSHREKTAYAGYQQAVEEEFGDALWYFTTLCRRLGISVDTIFSEVAGQDKYNKVIAASDLPDGPVSHILLVNAPSDLDKTLLNLGEATAALLGIKGSDKQTHYLLRTFSDCYLQALQKAQVCFSQVARMNIEKACGRFRKPDMSTLPTFDSKFPDEEQLPQKFNIKITQRKGGQSYLQWNDVFIGDPLTDNIPDPDGYRFHDVFHFAHAAILHWSPTFRSLIKHKRKSDPELDEAQDSGRARVVEEGLAAWVFSRAKQLNFFQGQDSLSFDLLKTVQQFVQGYEVEKCPLNLWEQAILEGYKVFIQVRDNNGGIVIGNRETRTIAYKPIDGE